MTKFQKAQRRKAYIKLAITGTAGSGKTYSALLLARGLVGKKGRIAVIDTENNSSTLYDTLTDFDQCELKPRAGGSFHHQDFSDAIKEAEAAGYDCVIIDSASHLWQAILDLKQTMDDSKPSQSFGNWAKAGKDFNAVLQKMLQCNMHVIACIRVKMKHELVDGKVKQLGLDTIMRDGIEYEFTTVFDVKREDHKASASKDRTGIFERDGEFLITESTGEKIARWIDGGADMPEPTPDIAHLAEQIRSQVKGDSDMTATVKSLCNGKRLEELPEAMLTNIAKTVGIAV